MSMASIILNGQSTLISNFVKVFDKIIVKKG